MADAAKLVFTDDTKPVASKDNPYTEIVKLIAGTDKVKSFEVKGVADQTKNAELAKARRQLTEAGDVVPVTVRTDYEQINPETVKVRFWTAAKIKRVPKPVPATPAVTETPAPTKGKK